MKSEKLAHYYLLYGLWPGGVSDLTYPELF